MQISIAESRVIPFKNWTIDSADEQNDNILNRLKPVLGEKILVVGCADGAMAKIIKDRGCSVVAVDNNIAMIEQARDKGLDARLMNGENLIFENEFDAVVSYSALHWMRHPDKVIAGAWKSLKMGGRFVGEMGAYGNIDKVISIFLKTLEKRGINAFYLIPWYFPSVQDYNKRLKNKGFFVQNIEEAMCLQPLDIPLRQWIRGKIGEAFVSVLPKHELENFYTEVEKNINEILPIEEKTQRKIIEYRTLAFDALKLPEI